MRTLLDRLLRFNSLVGSTAQCERSNVPTAQFCQSIGCSPMFSPRGVLERDLWGRRTGSPSYSAYDGLPVRRPRRTARTTDFQSVGQGVQRVRRTSSPSAKAYSAYDGLPVRRPKRTGGSMGATDWKSVVQGDQNVNSLQSLKQPPFRVCKHRIPPRTRSRSNSPKQARGLRR